MWKRVAPPEEPRPMLVYVYTFSVDLFSVPGNLKIIILLWNAEAVVDFEMDTRY
jgi:hypothetical protein